VNGRGIAAATPAVTILGRAALSQRADSIKGISVCISSTGGLGQPRLPHAAFARFLDYQISSHLQHDVPANLLALSINPDRQRSVILSVYSGEITLLDLAFPKAL